MGTFLSFLLVLLVPNALGIQHSYSYCGSNKTTYTPNSTYYHNLVDLLFLFTQEGDSSIELFSNITVGKRPPDIVYGLYLCRADILPSNCLNCLIEASKEITEQCPIQKEAIRWSDDCMLHYANQSVLWNMEVVPIDYACNKANISKLETEQKRFQDIVVDMMDELVVMASNHSKRYAYKETIYNGTQRRMFGLMQCTQDLSGSDCDRCLRTHVSRLVNKLCGGKVGGRLSTPSCNFRYERYKFYGFQTQEDGQKVPSTTQSDKKKKLSLKIVVIITLVCVFLALLGIIVVLIERRRRRKHVTRKVSMNGTDDNEIVTEQSLQIDLKTIEAATANFSDDNKVGEGGFGSVYKGVLLSGKKIAVKRLSKGSGQGAQEFKNEVVLLAKLQHRNLVRLLGFCLEAEEKILIYEYVPNKSLDYFLFEPIKKEQFDWVTRCKVIGGIARGMLYLHEDSRLRIIHRDLKASNILLDEEMNAKISDFGMARIFCVNQTQASTNRIVGTFGYMSPEYAMHGNFSTQSDIFSFGVLVLEIISGERNNGFYRAGFSGDLLCYAWDQWRNKTPLEFIDPSITHSTTAGEIMRFINIGLLCVQKEVDARPSMATVVSLINSFSIALPLPQEPPFFVSKSSKGTGQNPCSTESIIWSVNTTPISQMHPR